MNRIVIIGGGGHAKVIINILKKLNKFDIVGYTDVEDKGEILGVRYLGKDDILHKLSNQYNDVSVILGIGSVIISSIRRDLYNKIMMLDLRFPPIISPDSIVNEDVFVDEGTIVFDGVVINSGTKIGKCSIINTNSTIEHDCEIEDFVHIAPGVTVSGGVIIGKNTLIGTGSSIIQGIRISSDCLIGAGSVIIHDCLEPGVYVGNPAQKIK